MGFFLVMSLIKVIYKLILIMNLAICRFGSRFWVSRAKTLLKRRKIAAKSRPISSKKLAQQQKLFNYAHEYKALQMQKQLDRRSYASQHINELIQQIFYPDITQAHQQAAQLHIESSMLKQHHFYIGDRNGKQDMGRIEDGDGDKKRDVVMEDINQKMLGTDVIEYCNQNVDKLDEWHYLAAMRKLTNYFRQRQKIKSKVESKWKKMNETMKKNDKKYQQKKCPYLFIDREDTFHYAPWNVMINNLCVKFEGLVTSDEGFLGSFFVFGEIMQNVGAAVHYVPLRVYEIFEKCLSELTPDQLNSLSTSQSHHLLKSITLKPSIRYPAYHTIPSPTSSTSSSIPITPQSSTSTSTTTTIPQPLRIPTLLQNLLTSPQLTHVHVVDIIKFLKTGIMPFSADIAEKFKSAILGRGVLGELGFQGVVDLLGLFLRMGKVGKVGVTGGHGVKIMDYQFLELLKFDVLRKSPNATNINYIFKCLQYINNRHLQAPQHSKHPSSYTSYTSYPSSSSPFPKIYANDLLQTCSNTLLSKYHTLPNKTPTGSLLGPKLVLQLVNIFFRNFVGERNSLEFVAGEIVKVRAELALGEITDAVFKVYILGYRSEVLGRVLFDQQVKRYHEAKKKIRNQDIQLLQGKSDPIKDAIFAQHQKIPQQQLALEQNLIISLWILISTLPPSTKPQISTLLPLYPTSTISPHPLIHQLCLNLNNYTKSNNILYKIKCPIPIRRDGRFYNRLDGYYIDGVGDMGTDGDMMAVMRMEAEDSCQFQRNYHVGVGKFLREGWSGHGDHVYQLGDYVQYLKDGEHRNYFNREKEVSEQLRKLRAQTLLKYQQKQASQKKNKNNTNRQSSNQEQNQEEGQKMYRID